MSPLDLRIGNPEFLAKYWDSIELSPLHLNSKVGDKSYQDSSGIELLKEQILALHGAVGNAFSKNKYVVIGAGATQVLAAALYAGKKMAGHILYAKPPYYFRFPMIAEVTEMALLKEPPIGGKSWVELITAPSNPMNELDEPSDASFKIYDLCYNWNQYGDVIKRNEDIMVFGLSKATGHASTRIGWALVKDPEVAQLMTQYMEYSSSGTSIEGQRLAAQVIAHQIAADPEDDVFTYGRSILEKRWGLLKGLKSKRFTIHNSSGMFAWMSFGRELGVKELQDLTGVLGTSGPGCGGKRQHVRLNVGCTDDKFWDLIQRLFAVK